jgi:hypothetical protein
MSKTKLNVGDKVKFYGERTRYTVQAADERFAVCNRPCNLRKAVNYTMIDFEKKVRGPEDLIFGMGAETREKCEEMLCRLNDAKNPSAVSRRNFLPLDIVVIDPAKEPLRTEWRSPRTTG